MIELEATIFTNGPFAGVDWSNASAVALRYECFLGDIRMKVAGVDFSTHWQWVPVLDFGLSLCSLLDSLQDGEVRIFEFTESEAAIRMRRVGDLIDVEATYVKGRASVSYRVLLESARDFAEHLIARLIAEYPELATNTEFRAEVARATPW